MKRRLEKKYGVHIVWDYWTNEYKLYSADGCLWENGLKNLKSVEHECEEWAMQLCAIRDNVKGVTV